MAGNTPPGKRGEAGFRIDPLAVVAVLVLLAVLLGVRLGMEAQQAEGAGVASEPTVAPLPDDVSGGLEFVDRTEELGLSTVHADPSQPGYWGTSSGVTVGDANLDGAWDLYVARIGRAGALFLNRGDGSFTDQTVAAGLDVPELRDGTTTAAFFDADLDGDDDLLVLGAGETASLFFRNDGKGSFTESTADTGLGLPQTVEQSGQLHSVTVADYDTDGDLDVLLLEWHWSFGDRIGGGLDVGESASGLSLCETVDRVRAAPGGVQIPALRSRLLRNDGFGRFDDVTGDVGLDLSGIAGMSSQFVDLDGDGDQDLVVAGDFCTSRVFHNLGGQFEDVTRRSGAGTDENGMGSAIGDINDDGRPDWFVTSIASAEAAEDRCHRPLAYVGCSGNRLYVNDGDLSFADESVALGVRDSGWGWGVAIEDFAAVGRPQIVATNGHDAATESGDAGVLDRYAVDPIRFWMELPDGSYAGAAPEVSLIDTSVGHGLVPVDVDADGRLDLAVANTPSGLRLFRNERPTTQTWLTVQLDDGVHPGNRRGEGARIAVTPRIGGPSRTGWILSSGSYESQKPPELHLGFGALEGPIDRVEVWWPGQPWDGPPQVVDDVEPNQVLTISRSE